MHYCAETDFGAYIKSASDSDDGKGRKRSVMQAQNEPAFAFLPAYPDQPACVTCGQARELGIYVQDINCWSSSRYRY